MHRVDDTIFLLFIEPDVALKSVIPIIDGAVKVMEYAIERAKKGTSNYHKPEEPPRFKPGTGYMGRHVTKCGVKSASRDYLLENGMITNSLCVYYLMYYRNSIPKKEMDKVNRLLKFYIHSIIT